MNNQATMEKLQQMKMYGMVRAFENAMETNVKDNFTADELLAHLVDAEWDDRYNRRMNRLIRGAKFRYQATMEQIDFQIKRNLDKNQVLRFSDCDWIRKSRDIILTGPTGVGKSFLATALGYKACHHGFKVMYFNCHKLFGKLKMARADGSEIKELKKIQKQDLLILDDFGLHPFDAQSRLFLLEIMEDRHGRKSTMIASQFPIKKWYALLGEPTIADAICDRIIHSAYRIELKGDSVRRKYGAMDGKRAEKEEKVS